MTRTSPALLPSARTVSTCALEGSTSTGAPNAPPGGRAAETRARPVPSDWVHTATAWPSGVKASCGERAKPPGRREPRGGAERRRARGAGRGEDRPAAGPYRDERAVGQRRDLGLERGAVRQARLGAGGPAGDRDGVRRRAAPEGQQVGGDEGRAVGVRRAGDRAGRRGSAGVRHRRAARARACWRRESAARPGASRGRGTSAWASRGRDARRDRRSRECPDGRPCPGAARRDRPRRCGGRRRRRPHRGRRAPPRARGRAR